MKKLSVAVLLSIFAIPTFAEPERESISYVAKASGNDKFCAKVQVSSVTGYRLKKKCRTIEEWEKKGYDVDIKKYRDEETPEEALS